MPEGKMVGYARVSSTGQDLDIQLERLASAGVELEDIFKEKRTGTDRGRPQPRQCLAYVRKGDTLLVTKIDRLARSTSDLYSIISQLQAKGVEFKVIEFENDIRKERQLEGIAKAKDRGVRFGVEPKLTDEVKTQIRQLRLEGMTVPAIMKQTELSKASVYRALSAVAGESGL
jgi:DNA invertase Pin-like site-specific DNA recombinase